MTYRKFSKQNNKWMSSDFIARNSKKVKGQRPTSTEELKLERASAERSLLIWIKKCSIHRICSSKFKKNEPRREDQSLMKISDWRYVISGMDAGLTIIFQLKYKQDSTDHLRLSSERSTIPPQIIGRWRACSLKWQLETSCLSQEMEIRRSILKMTII